MSASKALSVVTACKTSDQFIERYHQFCDDSAIFVATKKACPLGQELTFSIQLADRTAILRGAGCIEASFTSGDNRWKQPGIKIRVRRLTANSSSVFAKLQLHAAVASIDDLSPATAKAEHTPAAEPSIAPQPVVRFATGDERHVIAQPLDAADVNAEHAASESPFVDLLECMIFEATSDVIDADEEMIDLEPAPRRDETPLAAAVSTDGRRSLHRLVGKPRVVLMIASSLLVAVAGIAALRMSDEQGVEQPRSGPAKAAPPRALPAPAPPAPAPPAPAPPRPALAPAPPAPGPSRPAPTTAESAASPAKDCEVQIMTTPPDASIRIDGQDMRASSGTITVACGPHDIEISRRRYATVKQSLVLTPDYAARIDVALVRPTHAVSIETTPPDATITIAGKVVTSPIQVEGFKKVTLTISKPGWRTVTQQLYSKVPQERLVVRLPRQ